ncbi:MAG: SIMPL domain-containing protein [Bryobacteraceae bacterium]|nr:SIMPL domain-containing protein [Bryobacteraceae bacterium]
MKTAICLFLAIALPAVAQTTARRGYIAAYGEASISIRPDQARVNVGVLTQAPTATDAAAKNADQVASVIASLRSVLGAGADIRTINYSLGPTYQYASGGGQPMLTGFQANNVVQATIGDTTIIGRVIDAAIQGGATRVDGIQFGLKDEDPIRRDVLRNAAQKARQKADTIAAGLGVRTGAVIAADEGYQAQRVGGGDRSTAPGAAAVTPVETGTLEIRGTVTLQLEVLP